MKAVAAFAMLVLTAIAPASAQFNSPQAKGYVARAASMLAQGNYRGCLDQCAMAQRLGAPDRETLMWLCAQASYRGGFADAPARVNSFIKAFPNSTKLQQAKLMSASLTFFTGDYAAALPQLRAVNSGALEPGLADDLSYRTAYTLMMLGDYDEADRLFSQLRSTKSYGSAAAFYLGYSAFIRNDYPRAEKLFKEADEATDPGRMAPYYLAEIAYGRGDYQQALNLARPMMTLADAPASFTDEASRLCGESLYALGRENEGIGLLRKYFADHSDMAPASTLYILGTDAYRTGDYAQAIRLLSSPCFRQNAMGQSASLFLGLSQLAEGNNSAAIIAFQKAIDLDFDSSVTETAFYNYAVARVEGGRVPFGNSISTLEEFLRRFPNSEYAPAVQEYLINGYIGADDYEAALRSINSIKKPAAKVLDAKQRVNFVLGTRAYSAGDYGKALQYFREAEKLAARNADVARQTTLWLGDCLYALGQYADAEKQYRAFLSKAPRTDANISTATYNLGYALFGSRKYADARERLSVAAKAQRLGDATRADAYNRIADTYYYESDFRRALENYRLARETHPSTADYSMLQEAMMEGYLGNSKAKLSGLDRLVADFPGSPLAATALTEKALTFAASGKTADAMNVYRHIVSAYPSTSQGRNALLQLAILNLNAGRKPEAIDLYRQVVKDYPSSAEAAMAVQDLTQIYGRDDRIDELTAFLDGINGAPRVDAVQLNVLASASLLKKAKAATDPQQILAITGELLSRFPDSEGAEEALLIEAETLYQQGLTEEALADFNRLDAKASTAAMHHRARMGIISAASDLGKNDLIISTARNIRNSAAVTDSDLPRVDFLLAGALYDDGRRSEAVEIWTRLAKSPASLYGTRSALSLAEARRDASDIDGAIEIVNRLIDADPPHPYWIARAFILLSDLLRSQGNTFEADEYLRALRSNYPGSDADIYQMIDQRLPK